MSLLEKINELKEKFKACNVHKKKVKALQNYNFAVPLPNKEAALFSLVKKCMNYGFLDDVESSFLNHMLDKCGIYYLDWAHKTNWLKTQMKRLAYEHRKEQEVQLNFFDYQDVKPVLQPKSSIVKWWQGKSQQQPRCENTAG